MSVPPLVLGDRYRVGDVIGQGATADVHCAYDTVLDRSVAIKVLRDHTAHDARRFADEARLLAALDHPHIVRLLDAGVADERPWIALELVEGSTLRDLMSAGPLDADTAARVGRGVASALAHAHDSGVVHRDVKPGNILIGADGTAKLTDFGIARLDDEASGLTMTGFTLGTAAYLAPEQVRGEQVTGAGDVYALGLVLLEGLTGQRAYNGPPTEAALARLTRAPLVPTSLPPGWPSLLSMMTAAVADERPSADDVAKRLESSRPFPDTSAGPTETTQTPAVEPIGRRAWAQAGHRRGRRRVRGLVALAAALAVIASFGLARGLGESSPAVAESAKPAGSGASASPRKNTATEKPTPRPAAVTSPSVRAVAPTTTATVVGKVRKGTTTKSSGVKGTKKSKKGSGKKSGKKKSGKKKGTSKPDKTKAKKSKPKK